MEKSLTQDLQEVAWGGGVCESNCGNLPDAQKFKSLKITSLFSRWEHQAPDQWPKLEPQYDYFEA